MASIEELLRHLPTAFAKTTDVHSAMGAAIEIAHQMIADNGGRITVLTTTMPDVGPGALTAREDPNERASADVQHLTHATDYYQRVALECNGHQVAIDLFLMNTKPADLATFGECVAPCKNTISSRHLALLWRQHLPLPRPAPAAQRARNAPLREDAHSLPHAQDRLRVGIAHSLHEGTGATAVLRQLLRALDGPAGTAEREPRLGVGRDGRLRGHDGRRRHGQLPGGAAVHEQPRRPAHPRAHALPADHVAHPAAARRRRHVRHREHAGQAG